MLKVNKITTKFLSKQSFKKETSMYYENKEKIIEGKMTYSESESETDSNFATNSVSDFDSDFDPEPDSNSASMNLLIFGFFICICTLLNNPVDNFPFSFS